MKKSIAIFIVSLMLISCMSVNVLAVNGICGECGGISARLTCTDTYKSTSENFTCSYYENCVKYHEYYRTLETCSECGFVTNGRKVHTEYRYHLRAGCPKYAENGVNVCPY